VSCERRGQARREWSGCDRRQAQSTAQHSTAQHSSHNNTAAQAQAHRMNHLSTRFYFACRARTRATPGAAQSRAEQSRAHPLFTRRRQRGSPALLRTGSCQTGGPICRETKHLADDRPGQQRSSAGMTLNMKGGVVNIPWPIRGRGAPETPCGFERGFLEGRQKGSRRPRPDCATGS
jgi:hypothetical protein